MLLVSTKSDMTYFQRLERETIVRLDTLGMIYRQNEAASYEVISRLVVWSGVIAKIKKSQSKSVR
jgi:hypothetical protein